MSHQSSNVCNFLEELKNTANAGTNAHERERAARKLSDMLHNRKIYIVKSSHDLRQAAAEIMEAKERLEEIRRRLETLVKTNGHSNMMH